MFNYSPSEYDISPENFFTALTIADIPVLPGLTGCFDWLSCTFNCFDYEVSSDFTYAVLDKDSELRINALLEFFNRGDTPLNLFHRETGAYGFQYKICLQEGVYLLFYGPQTLNGVHATALNLTGKGCQWLIQRGKFIQLLMYCAKNVYRYTRFDSAIDDYTEMFPLSKIIYLIKNRFYTSVFKGNPKIEGTPNVNSETGYDGVTIYLGGTDLLYRIYAKNWKEGVQGQIKNWTRHEIQLRDHERIKQLVTLIIIGYHLKDYSNYFNIVASLLSDIITFRVPGKSDQKCRWDVDSDWLRFLNGVKSIKLFHAPKGKSDFEITKSWFEKSCTLFLTQLMMIYGEEKFFKYIKYLTVRRFVDFKENDFNVVINEFENQKKEFNRDKVRKMFKEFLKDYDSFEFDSSFIISDEAKEELKRLEEEIENE